MVYLVLDKNFEMLFKKLKTILCRKIYTKYYQYELLVIFTACPQGSIFRLLLFNIYINDLITVSNKLNFTMYADGTLL